MIPSKSMDPVAALNHPGDVVLLAKYGKRWRWWPNPPARGRGSSRWWVRPVEGWHWADSPEDARSQAAARMALPTKETAPVSPGRPAGGVGGTGQLSAPAEALP